jgi:predicted aspartyl protease
VRADVVRVGSVSVGEAEARDVLAVIHDLPDAPTGIDGLLGLTFLDRFVVTVDAQKGEMQLRQRR